MSTKNKIFRGTLLAKTLGNFTLWGFLLLLAPKSLLDVLDLPSSIYLRFCGFAGILLAFCFWQGYKNPEKNFWVVRVIFLDCLLFTLLVLYFSLTSAIPWSLWLSGVLTLIFSISLVLSGGKEFLQKMIRL